MRVDAASLRASAFQVSDPASLRTPLRNASQPNRRTSGCQDRSAVVQNARGEAEHAVAVQLRLGTSRLRCRKCAIDRCALLSEIGLRRGAVLPYRRSAGLLNG